MTELWAALIGAVFGGLLSLVGSIIVADYQRRREEHATVVRTLREFVEVATRGVERARGIPERDAGPRAGPELLALRTRAELLPINEGIVDSMKMAISAIGVAEGLYQDATINPYAPADMKKLEPVAAKILEAGRHIEHVKAAAWAEAKRRIPILPTADSAYPLA